MKKRGVSPLIATVLLIGFAVALAVVIINWGGSLVKQTQETSGKQLIETQTCLFDVDFKIISVDKGTNSFRVQNDGDIDIVGFITRVYTDAGVDVNSDLQELDEANTLKAFGVKDYILNSSLADATKIELLPVIKKDEQTVICSEQKVVRSL